ncbi:MAG TPA: O-antigen ligase family protein [Geminicoccaceae bacterium]|nr:O-antigen ligase family protein [Geminicoccus sp.]HMU48767.1 O-antigen ligase family protein [Geminicoccaceae bacterium]
MLRILTVVLMVVALFFMSFDSPKVGEEERRIWTPVVLGLAALVILLRVPLLLRVDRRVLLSPSLVWLVAYLLWLTLSQEWSISPAEGQNHITMLWVVLLASLAVSDEPPSRTALIYVGSCTLVILAGWAALAAGWPGALSPGEAWRFKGIIRHEQTMAFCAISAFLCATVWVLNRRRVDASVAMLPVGLALALALATVLATQARSFTAFFVLSLFAAWFFHLRGARKIYVLVAGLAVGGGLFLAIDVLMPLLSRGSEQQDVTLSGRTIVWEATIGEIAKRPLTGFGFGSYQDYFSTFWNGWTPGHAHNMWLHVAFESGIVGAVLITGFVLALLLRGLRFQRETGLLSHTLILTIFLLLADIMSVIIGGKLSTPYGLLLVLAMQEERLRSLVRSRVAAEAAAWSDPLPSLRAAQAT